MAKKTRVPNTIQEFNDYINNTDDYQAATTGGRPSPNWQYLGLAAGDNAAWSAQRTAWVILYAKYIDPAQRTKVIVSDVKAFMITFTTFVNPLLDIMAASPNAENDDEIQFNFKKKSSRQRPVRPTEEIQEQCFTTVKAIGGGELEFTCRTSHDTKRASKALKADSIQVAYKIGVTPPLTAPNPPDDPSGVESPDVCPNKEIFTKSNFILKAGPGNATKKLYVFARWFNTKHPELAGQWSPMATVPIA